MRRRRPTRPRSLGARTVDDIRAAESPADHYIRHVLEPSIRKWFGRYDRITEASGDELDPNVFIARLSLYIDEINPTELLGPPRRCSDYHDDDD